MAPDPLEFHCPLLGPRLIAGIEHLRPSAPAVPDAGDPMKVKPMLYGVFTPLPHFANRLTVRFPYDCAIHNKHLGGCISMRHDAIPHERVKWSKEIANTQRLVDDLIRGISGRAQELHIHPRA